MKTSQFFLFLVACSALTGCGQIGPLYLPGTAAPIYVPPEPKTEPKAKLKPAPKPEENK
jgi:predicted small lipoprotein YifL